MASVNKVTVIGNIGRDLELRHLPNGDAACNLAVATTRKWKNKDGEAMEETEWHRISLFGRRAEVAGKFLKKGSPIYIEGHLKTRKWTDKDGVEKYTTEIIADDMQFLSDPRSKDSAPATATAPPPRPAPVKTGFDDMDDDIPF